MVPNSPLCVPDTRYNVALVGAPGVGKTAIARAWGGETTAATTGVDTYTVQAGRHRRALLLLHDIGRKSARRQVTRVLREADAVVLVYDCQRIRETLDKLSNMWNRRLSREVSKHAALVLVANRDSPQTLAEPTMPLCQEERSVFDLLPSSRKMLMRFSDLDNVAAEASLSRTVLLDFIRNCRASARNAGDETNLAGLNNSRSNSSCCRMS